MIGFTTAGGQPNPSRKRYDELAARFEVTPTSLRNWFGNRQSKLEAFDGFKGFILLRRDGSDPDGFNYSTWSVWRDRAAFDAWMGSQKKPAGPPKGSGGGAPPPSIYAKPPVPTFYEGILMLESEGGI